LRAPATPQEMDLQHFKMSRFEFFQESGYISRFDFFKILDIFQDLWRSRLRDIAVQCPGPPLILQRAPQAQLGLGLELGVRLCASRRNRRMSLRFAFGSTAMPLPDNALTGLLFWDPALSGLFSFPRSIVSRASRCFNWISIAVCLQNEPSRRIPLNAAGASK